MKSWIFQCQHTSKNIDKNKNISSLEKHKTTLSLPLLKYGSKAQQLIQEDTSPVLNKIVCTKIQQIEGIILCYAHAVNPTLPKALGSIASEQAHVMKNTETAIIQLM